MITLTVDVIAIYGGGVVVIKRDYFPPGLALPGGKVEEGESIEKALVRELKEETNLDIISMKQFHTYSEPDRDPRGHYISTVFVCEASGELKAGSDAKNTRIIKLDEIDSLKDKFAFDHYKILCDYRKNFN